MGPFKIFIQVILLFFLISTSFAYQPCDTVRTCVGRTLKFSQTEGKGAHYIDILNTNLTQKVNSNMTFELWLKPERQAGKLQYIGGMWGPADEKYDSWVVYISSQDSLVFHINGQNEKLGNFDDTRLSVPFSSYYNSWNHFAFVADGTTGWIYIYVNANPVDSARNQFYPYKSFKHINNPDLSPQIGSTNALSNDLSLHRTYKGLMDEIRIWGRTFNANDFICMKDKSMSGSEKDLFVYYRCNDSSYIYTLCDASGNKNFGYLRSGLSTIMSDRKDFGKVVVTPIAIKDTVYCDTEKIYEFTLLDTALCATGSSILAYQGFNDKFYFLNGNQEQILTKWRTVQLEPGIPLKVRIKVKLDIIGTIKTTLLFRNTNSCGYYHLNVPVTITRKSELSMSNLQIRFDSLKARCIEKSFIDSTLKICNTAQNQVTISSISLKMPQVFQLTYPSLPKVLNPGECFDVKMRFVSRDTTMAYFDTLKIVSTDKCAPNALIPIYGKVNEVLSIWRRGTKMRLDSFNFGQSCVNMPANSVEYEWFNNSDKNITIENVIIPPNFFGKSLKFPVILEPITGYNPNYFRFFPKTKGTFRDSIVFIAKSEGCTIHYPVYIYGKGYEADISFSTLEVDFGTVIVGQQKTINAEIENKSEQGLVASLYLRKGDPFSLTGTRSSGIKEFSKNSFPITFIPTSAGNFEDEVCLYENTCYQSYCIKVKGKAVVQLVEFLPEILKISDVVSCQSKDGTLEIQNISNVIQTYLNFTLKQQSNLFKLINPNNLPNSITLQPNEKASFTFRYTPNDNINDRSDRAYLEFETTDRTKWSAKIYGYSIVPKIYLTSEVLFETLEVGGVLFDTLHLENISNYPITISNYSISNGFELIYPLDIVGRKLNPKDTIQVVIAFKPTEGKSYNGKFTIFSDEPCPIESSTDLSGIGITIPLDVPLKVITYGFVRPCDCQTRSIPLINNSFYFPMTIDSIWIDSTNVSNPHPEFYSWSSYYSPNASVPYSIPKRATDTLYIKYCPKSLLIPNQIDNDARLFLRASGSGWADTYTSYLAGKQTLLFRYDTLRVFFPPTRVDTVSKPQYIRLKIPSLDFNPSQVSIQIDTIEFVPNERVFYVRDSLDRPLNIITIDTNNTLVLETTFKPRAARYYENRMKVIIKSPCFHFDTTVVLSGSGFAPAYGLSFNFHSRFNIIDTFKVVPCDTLAIPVYSSRSIPANVVDIDCRIGYDTTKLEFLYATSDYLNQSCPNYNSFINHKHSQFGGSQFLLKNFCKVDSLKPIFTAYFKPKTNNRDTFNITLDSIRFDTEEIIMYNIIAENDKATVIIQKPELTASNIANFDSVRVLDCSERTITLKNTGDVPLNAFSLLNLTKELFFVTSSPPLNDTLAVGDSINIIIKYCPRKSDTLNHFLNTIASIPCLVLDSNKLVGRGYAPRYDISFDTQQTFYIPDTLTTQISDTLIVPLFIDKDLNTTINNNTYWLDDISFNINLEYNPFALEFLEAKNYLNANFNHSSSTGNISLIYNNAKRVEKGKLAEIKFITPIPDKQFNKININISEFVTDSIMFLDLYSATDSTYLLTNEKCGLTYLNYTGIEPSLSQNYPNPFAKTTEIHFSIAEKLPVELKLYSINGKLIKTLLDKQLLNIGKYKIILNSEGLPPGLYYYILQSPNTTIVKSMMIIN